jgi:hypothetical protein
MMTELFTELSEEEACDLLHRFHISRNNDKPSMDFVPSSRPDTQVLLPPSYFSSAFSKAKKDEEAKHLLAPADFELLTPAAILARGKRSRDETDCVYPDFLLDEPLPKCSLARVDEEFEDMWESVNL